MNNEYKITLQIPYSFMSIKLYFDAIGLDIPFTDIYNVGGQQQNLQRIQFY